MYRRTSARLIEDAKINLGTPFSFFFSRLKTITSYRRGGVPADMFLNGPLSIEDTFPAWETFFVVEKFCVS